jgi:hypothetical protein
MSVTDLETRLGRVECELGLLTDREAIRDVIYRYCRAVDRADDALLKSCYWPDGFDDHGFFGGNAWEFADHVCKLLRFTTATTHSCSNPIIDLDGQRAYCETQVDVIHRHMEGDNQVYEWGQCRYLDEFERRDGVWRILVRTVVADGMHWLKLENAPRFFALRELADMAGLPPSARHPADAVYRLRELRDIVKTRAPTADFWLGLRAVSRGL